MLFVITCDVDLSKVMIAEKDIFDFDTESAYPVDKELFEQLMPHHTWDETLFDTKIYVCETPDEDFLDRLTKVCTTFECHATKPDFDVGHMHPKPA